jgi:hypothetical protein
MRKRTILKSGAEIRAEDIKKYGKVDQKVKKRGRKGGRGKNKYVKMVRTDESRERNTGHNWVVQGKKRKIT